MLGKKGRKKWKSVGDYIPHSTANQLTKACIKTSLLFYPFHILFSSSHHCSSLRDPLMHFRIKICIHTEYVTLEALPECVLWSSVSFSHSVRRYQEALSGFVNTFHL